MQQQNAAAARPIKVLPFAKYAFGPHNLVAVKVREWHDSD
jgi:hypothetical protein